MKLLVTSFLLISFTTSAQNFNSPEPVLALNTKFPSVRDFTLSSSGEEAYISVQSGLSELSVIALVKRKKNGWSEPELVSFSGKYSDLEPIYSLDNLRLYFASNRPLDDSDYDPKDYDIWYVERPDIDSTWGSPINMGAPINTEHNEFYPSLSQNNNLYFTSDNPISKGKDDILFSEWQNGKYAEPISLNEAINSEGYEFNASVSPDESYLIFSGYNRADGMGSGDLYISYKDGNGNWKKAVNLGAEVNSKFMDYCPFVDQKSMTLYFTSKRSSFKKVYDFRSMDEVTEEINKYENGMSKIYKVDFGEIVNKANSQ